MFKPVRILEIFTLGSSFINKDFELFPQKSQHHIGDGLNHYEQAIIIMGKH